MDALEIRPVEARDLFPLVRRNLVRVLLELGDGEWSNQTACAGWDVHDVALHIAGGLLSNVSRRRDGHAGNIHQFARDTQVDSDQDTFIRTLNSWNESWVLAARRISPALTIELVDVAGAALEDYFRTLNLDAYGDAVGWSGPDPAPIWLDVAREYTEMWTHAAQIREATGRRLIDDPRLFAPVLQTSAYGVPHALREVECPEGTALRVILTGEGGGEWWVVRDLTGWQRTGRIARQPDATVEIDGVTAWRLATKGIAPEDARARARVGGDPGLVAGFFNLVAILA